MPTTFFVGITPPTEFAARVFSWQAGLEHIITAPHVTLLAPAAGPQRRWQAAAAQVAANHLPVAVKLGGPAFFGSRVIFLKVDAPGLHDLHRALVEALGDQPGEFALEHYHPHLTLALSWRAMNLPWDGAADRAQQVFGELDAQPLTFTARELVLFGKVEAGQPYTERDRFRLGTTS